MQPSLSSRTLEAMRMLEAPSVSPSKRKRDEAVLFLVIFVSVLSLTPLLALAGATFGFSLVVGGIGAIAVALCVVRWPVTGLYVVAGCALLVEQVPLQIGNQTLNYYIFFWPPQYAGLIERPIGFFIWFVFAAILIHQFIKRKPLLKGGALFIPFLLFLLCIAMGVAHGLTSGGNLKIIVEEVRPFWYLFESYLLAYNLVKHKKHVRFIFWMIIICAGIKGMEGTYIYAVILHGNLVNNHQIMSHEESFFFSALILLIILLSIHTHYRPQFYAALLVLPFVLIALVANQRRADYVALLVGIAVAWALVFMVKPQRRKALVVGMLIFVALLGGYIAAFYNSSGSIGGPARGIVSVFHNNPNDPADAASNLYRYVEDYDLLYTEKQSPILGYGFGKEFLQPLPLIDISADDPVYLYIPHNTVYWIYMRLGPIGYAVFWYLIAAIIVRGCLIARRLRDNYLQLVAIFVVSITIMEIIVAFADYQLYFYRNVIYLGLLVGVLLRLPALDTKEEKELASQ